MCSKCENCELFLTVEQERIEWYKELSFKNIILHKKLIEQQEMIIVLKKKLLDKRSNVLSEYVTDLVNQTSRYVQNEHFQSASLLERNIKEKLLEVNVFLETFNSERESFQQEIEENEKHFSESITYLNGLVDYFRESLFEELDKSNRVKQFFIKKISGLASNSHQVILNTLKEEGERLNNELKLRYRKTIEKSKEETERQAQLVSKLRKHNRQLYSLIQKSKMENETKSKNLEKNIEHLNMTIKKLKEKNDCLHTQIKLEVEGCKNDINDARKRIRKLLKPEIQQSPMYL